MVIPFARALELLSAFTPGEPCLGNRELADRTGLPASTVTRLTQSLVVSGYLRHITQERKYRLAPAVLGLGHGAVAHSEVQRIARNHMQTFADQHKVHVNLSSRDRLDMVVLESCRDLGTTIDFDMRFGVRVGIESSPLGWALLAALPDLERHYLLEKIERRMPREWQRLRRRCSEAIHQVHERGFCLDLAGWNEDLCMVAAPVRLRGQAPLVLACVGAGSRMSRSRVEREVGPRLVTRIDALQRQLVET